MVALLLASLAGICLIVGAVTLVAVRAVLVGELDSQVQDATVRAAAFTELVRSGSDPPPPNPAQARGLAPGTVTAIIVDGEVVRADRQSGTAQPEQLPAELDPVWLGVPVDGQVHTRAWDHHGDYRLSAVRTDAGDTVVAGLPLAGVQEMLSQVALVLGGVSLAGLAVTGVVGGLVVRRTLRPLERVADTATRVTQLALDRGEVALPVRAPGADAGTEVGRVAAALNRMLGHVSKALAARQTSETRVRRFVADASHELRTPLASIRGYAELARRHGEAVPPAVRHAISRVEAESTRMTTLVEELLLLATLDSSRPVLREPVDLSRVVVDAVADAQVAGPDHRWQLAAPAEPVTVLGDPDQLHQSVINLLTNARAHTPAGTTVRTGLSAGAGVVRVAVTDDGPGIPDEVLPEVFERFTRADTARSRTPGRNGNGLGLAIVKAVVAAHGGQVEVTSRPGCTAFTVTLPDAGTHSASTAASRPVHRSTGHPGGIGVVKLHTGERGERLANADRPG